MIEMCPTEKQKRLIKKRIQYFGEEKVLIPRVIRGVYGRDK